MDDSLYIPRCTHFGPDFRSTHLTDAALEHPKQIPPHIRCDLVLGKPDLLHGGREIGQVPDVTVPRDVREALLLSLIHI